MVCSICKGVGHNRQTCKFAPKNKKEEVGSSEVNWYEVAMKERILKEKLQKESDSLNNKLIKTKRRLKVAQLDADQYYSDCIALHEQNEHLEGKLIEFEDIAEQIVSENNKLKDKSHIMKYKNKVLECLEIMQENGIINEGKYLSECDGLKD